MIIATQNPTFYTLMSEIIMRYTVNYNLQCTNIKDMIFSPVISYDIGDKKRDMGGRSSVVGPQYAILNLNDVLGETGAAKIIDFILDNKNNHKTLTNYNIINMIEQEARANLKTIYDNKTIETHRLEEEFTLYTGYVEHDQNFKPSIDYGSKMRGNVERIQISEDSETLSELMGTLVRNVATGFKQYSHFNYINMTAIQVFLRQEKINNHKNLYEIVKSKLAIVQNTNEVLNYLYESEPKKPYSEEVPKDMQFNMPEFTLSTLVNLLKSSGFAQLNKEKQQEFITYCADAFIPIKPTDFNLRRDSRYALEFYEFIKFLSDNTHLITLERSVEILDNACYQNLFTRPNVEGERQKCVLKLLSGASFNGDNLSEIMPKIQSWGDKYFTQEQALPIMEARLLDTQLSRKSESAIANYSNIKI